MSSLLGCFAVSGSVCLSSESRTGDYSDYVRWIVLAVALKKGNGGEAVAPG